MHDVSVRLSTIRVFMLFNFLYADVWTAWRWAEPTAAVASAASTELAA